MEGVGFKTYTAASHQGGDVLVSIWGAVTSSIFVYSLCFMQKLFSFNLTTPANRITVQKVECIYSWTRSLCL